MVAFCNSKSDFTASRFEAVSRSAILLSVSALISASRRRMSGFSAAAPPSLRYAGLRCCNFNGSAMSIKDQKSIVCVFSCPVAYFYRPCRFLLTWRPSLPVKAGHYEAGSLAKLIFGLVGRTAHRPIIPAVGDDNGSSRCHLGLSSSPRNFARAQPLLCCRSASLPGSSPPPS